MLDFIVIFSHKPWVLITKVFFFFRLSFVWTSPGFFQRLMLFPQTCTFYISLPFPIAICGQLGGHDKKTFRAAPKRNSVERQARWEQIVIDDDQRKKKTVFPTRSITIRRKLHRFQEALQSVNYFFQFAWLVREQTIRERLTRDSKIGKSVVWRRRVNSA